MELQGKRVVVVGGTAGIGLAAARRCRALGAEVVVGGRRGDRLEAARREVPGVEAIAVDVTQPEEVRRFGSALGSLDHLVLPGSSGAAMGTLDAIDFDRAAAFLDSKLLGPARVAQGLAPAIRDGGSITFFSGAASRKLAPGGAMISAVNAAVEALASTLALELAPIRVNTVAPGLTDTPVWDELLPPGTRDTVLAQAAASVPLKRVASPDEIADAVVFLLTCGYATGSVVFADGGYARS
jgi:NAD(P)-dependent dehydrogenase (short-subunit alcohol dehydrogenase family)